MNLSNPPPPKSCWAVWGFFVLQYREWPLGRNQRAAEVGGLWLLLLLRLWASQSSRAARTTSLCGRSAHSSLDLKQYNDSRSEQRPGMLIALFPQQTGSAREC